jgi:hypothetical protein
MSDRPRSDFETITIATGTTDDGLVGLNIWFADGGVDTVFIPKGASSMVASMLADHCDDPAGRASVRDAWRTDG